MPSTSRGHAPSDGGREHAPGGAAAEPWSGSPGALAAGFVRHYAFAARLLDEVLRRGERPGAADGARRAGQAVLPMLDLDVFAVGAGATVAGGLYVGNDGPRLDDVRVEIHLGGAVAVTHLGPVDARSVHRGPTVEVAAPGVAGGHELVLRVLDGGRPVADNRYPIHVVATAPEHGGGRALLVIGEGALDDDAGEAVRARLGAGEVVVVLAQPPEAAGRYPVSVRLGALPPAGVRVTTDHGALPTLPRRAVLVAEDLSVAPDCVVTSIAGFALADTPIVVTYDPLTGSPTGTVVGSHAVGPGRLVCCQYRLTDRAAAGDAVAGALLADVMRWATLPRPALRGDRQVKADGRRLTAYTWVDGTAE